MLSKENKEFALKILSIVWGSKISKTGSALALLGAFSLLGWLDQVVGYLIGFQIPQPADWIGILVMLVGCVLLVWDSSRKITPVEPNPHDIRLMNSFRAIVTNQLLDFLRNHNFGTPWRRADLDSIADIAEGWKGARFEFQDEELNNALDAVKDAANSLEEKIAYGTGMLRNNPEMQTAKTDHDYKYGIQQSTIDTINDLNTRATVLAQAIDELERIGGRKLPVT